VCDLEATGGSSLLGFIRSAAALTRMLPTDKARAKENTDINISVSV
jgi:hypothetical protein